MSWHCGICGNPDQWMRGKECPKVSGMIELFVNRGFQDKKVSLGVYHADCIQKVLQDGQEKYMSDGELSEFEELKKFKRTR
jgi:hypothetical protein